MKYLLKAFENEGAVAVTTSIPEISKLVAPKISAEENNFNPDGVLKIDLSALSANPPDVLALLASSPVFCQKDFKELLQKATLAVSRNIRTFETNIIDEDTLFDPDSTVTIVYSEAFSVCAAEIVRLESTMQVSINRLVQMLNIIEDKQLAHLHYSWVYLHKIYLFSLQLAANRLYYPRLWQAEKETYVLQYVPAIFCNEVKAIFVQLTNYLPSGITEVRKNDKKKTKLSISEPEQELSLLCGLFVNHFVSKTYEDKKFPTAWYERPALPQVVDLFIDGIAEGFITFETSRIPSSIHQWLSVFGIHARKYVPVLQVEEHENGFVLSLLVSESQQKAGSPVELSKVFGQKKYDSNRLEILKDLSIVGNYLPQVNTLLSTHGKDDIVVSVPDFSILLVNVLPIIKLLGINIILPKSLKSLVHPQLSLQLKKAKGKQVSIKSLVGLTDMLDYDWQITLGDKLMDVNEFMKMVKGLQGLVKLRDQYIFLDEAELKALQKNLEKNNELSSFLAYTSRFI